MKVAWIAVSGPPTLRDEALARLEVIADTYLSMNAAVQLALPAMLEERQSHSAAADASRPRQTLLNWTGNWPRRSCAIVWRWKAAGTPSSAFPHRVSDEDLAIALLQEKDVLVQPGHFYDFAADGYLVVSLITPESEFAEGSRRLLEFVNHSQ